MVETLQQQLHQTARHASRPPSSDPPQPPRPRRPRGKRRRGGPPGPPGPTRTLRSGDEVDERVVRKPAPGPDGHTPCSGDDPRPWRPQGLEMPPMHPGVTASQGPQLVGPPWSAAPRVPWPAGVPRGRDGPRVPATVARCPGAYRLSKRLTQQALEAIGGLPRRGATVSPWEQATTTVCAAPGEEARPSGHAQGVAHLAETSGRHGDQRGWLWGAVPRGVTVFVGRVSRGGDGARARRGEPWAGLVGTDRARASHG
jgi:transposase